MARNIRDRRNPNKLVVHITARVVEGLPFVPRLTINRTIKGIMAHAQTLYPVTICAFVFMGNHFHFILAGDGNRISSFMGFLQGELAKTFKRFIPGKYATNFWKDRFREQKLGNPEAVIEKLCYLFCNPVKASLVRSIEEYPGLNSFHAFKNSNLYKSHSELVPRVPVRNCKPLSGEFRGKRVEIELAKEQIENSSGYYNLTITPFAWVKCFQEEVNEEEVRERVLSHIEEIKKEKGKVLGKEKLVRQHLYKRYKPKKWEPTPYIDCPDRELRKELIKSYQNFKSCCKEAWEKIKRGVEAVWPLGAFVPNRLFRPLRVPVPV